MLGMRSWRRRAKIGGSARARGVSAIVAAGVLAAVAVPAGAFAEARGYHGVTGHRGHRGLVNRRGHGRFAGNRGHRNIYRQLNLISDIPGVARITDPHLVNPWGLAAGPMTPLWVADNGADMATVYSGGVRGSVPHINPLAVKIPGGAPTGIVFNPTSSFPVMSGGMTHPAAFIFDSEAGVISAWAPTNPAQPQAQKITTTSDAVYKGLAMAHSSDGPLIYATNFHAGTIDVFDQNFKPVTMPGAFTDPNIPAGFAPFGIQELEGKLYVTYAKQDAAKHDDVAGPGNGFVDVYDNGGKLLRRLVSHGDLNSPWGLAIAPRHFGPFGGDLLVGNFGDGAIHAFNPHTGTELGQLMNADGNPIQIDSLWALRFGNGVTGTRNTLLFTAGIGDEDHGLFGEILPRHSH